MPVIVFPGTALTVFEKQNFISRFSINAGSTLTSYTITPSDTVSSSFANQVTVSIDTDQRSSLTISGYYDDIFVNTTVTGVPARGSSVTTWTNWTSIPTDPYPYAITGFDPDPRTRIDMTITINTNNGTTSLVQWVRIDYNYWRNRFLALVHNSQVDARTNNNSYRAPDLPLPANIDSDTLKEAFIFSTSITGTLTYFDLNASANLAGYDAQRGSVPLYADVNIAAGAIVQATSTATWAFTTGDLPTSVGQHQITINNAGEIRGMGGAGGTASGANGLLNGSPGNAGGTAINLTTNVSINNTGQINGGGGGGGGGAGARSVLFGYFTFFTEEVYGGGGGGGPRLGAGGAASYGNPNYRGKVATETAPGAGGVANAYSSTRAGVGGSGGTFGNTGVAGAGGSGNNFSGTGGAGGTAGKAIALNGKTVTYINTGTINGAVA
jgi:hypothetical protein